MGNDSMCTQDQMELIIARQINPRLSTLEGKIEVFTTQISYFTDKMAEQKKSNEVRRLHRFYVILCTRFR